MFSDLEHGVGDLDHVGTALSRSESQQRPDLRNVHTALILKGLLLQHSLRIGQEFDPRGAGRARTDDDQIMSPGL